MKTRYKIGVFAGIPVYVHFTFLLLLAFFGWISYGDSGSVGYALLMVVYIITIFSCIVLHEYGHALTAKRFDVKTKDIIVLPIGGVARLERMPDKPWQEFLIAINGPLVNVAIAVIIMGVMSFTHSWATVREQIFPVQAMSDSFWMNVARINLIWIVFNLLPAFPMDGGRIVRSLLAMFIPYDKATMAAAFLGRVMSALFLLEAVGYNTIPFINGEGNFLLGIIAFFVWMGAGSEARFAMMKTRLHRVPVSRIMVTDFRTLSPRDTAEWAAEIASQGLQQDFPVADQGQVVGMMYHGDLIAGLARREPYLMVGDIMRKDVPTIQSTQYVEEVYTQVIGAGHPIVPVVNRGLLVGLLPIERLLSMPPNPQSAGQPIFRNSPD